MTTPTPTPRPETGRAKLPPNAVVLWRTEYATGPQYLTARLYRGSSEYVALPRADFDALTRTPTGGGGGDDEPLCPKCGESVYIDTECMDTAHEVVRPQWWVDRVRRASSEPLARIVKVPDNADLMTAEEWAASKGGFNGHDGHGYWATAAEMDREADCFGKRPEWATHVAWFNK